MGYFFQIKLELQACSLSGALSPLKAQTKHSKRVTLFSDVNKFLIVNAIETQRRSLALILFAVFALFMQGARTLRRPNRNPSPGFEGAHHSLFYIIETVSIYKLK